MYRARASRAPRSSITLSSSSIALATTKPPIFTARLPHLAVRHERYKSVQALRPHLLLPPTSSLFIINHHPKNTRPSLNLRNHSADCTRNHHGSDITATLATHDIYTSPHTNNMGVQIPTEQWAQVCKQVGGRKFGLVQHIWLSSCVITPPCPSISRPLHLMHISPNPQVPLPPLRTDPD
jgi:hypothetical protein